MLKAGMWSVETENRFVSLFQAEPVLWNPTHRICKAQKDHDVAWVRISKKMGFSVPELKRLKNTLYTKFFYRLRKYQKSSQSGEKFEIYNPDWFANEPINAFFGSIYQLRLGCKKASIKYPVKKDSGTENYVSVQRERSADLMHEKNSQYPVSNDLCPLKKHRRKNPPKRIMLSSSSEVSDCSYEGGKRTFDGSSVNIDGSFKPLNSTPINYSSSSHQSWPGQSIPPLYIEPETNTETSVVNGPLKAAKDDCDMYATLLATKLRKLPEKDRLQLMYKIDGLLISGIVPQQNFPAKPLARPFVQNFFPYSYPSTSQFSYLFHQSVMGSSNPPYPSFSISPPK